jgi:hypothetical protein
MQYLQNSGGAGDGGQLCGYHPCVRNRVPAKVVDTSAQVSCTGVQSAVRIAAQ